MKLTQKQREDLAEISERLQYLESDLERQPGEAAALAAAEIRGAIQDLNNVTILDRITLKSA